MTVLCIKHKLGGFKYLTQIQNLKDMSVNVTKSAIYRVAFICGTLLERPLLC